MSQADSINVDHPLKTVLSAVALLGAVLLAVVGVDYLLRSDTFPVRNVSFEGDFKRVDQRQLAEAVAARASGNFFALDLAAVQHAAEAVPWVHQATVRRRWPDGVHIQFSEQQLAARWGATAWVNTSGELVELPASTGVEGLITLDGPPGSPGAVLTMWRRLQPIVAARGFGVTRLRLTTRYTWDIELNNGLLLVAGRAEPERKLARFLEVYDQTVAGRTQQIRYVDLRYTNGFTVEWRADAGGTPPKANNEG